MGKHQAFQYLGTALKYPPQRIISLVPSLTELLFDLGMENEVIGITKFCIHPTHWFKSKLRIGGTKDIKLDKIQELKPDFIIASKEENVQEQVEALYPNACIFLTDIQNMEDALACLQELGKCFGKQSEANVIQQEIESSYNITPISPPKKVLYLIWKKPYMSIGKDTFIFQTLNNMGFNSVVNEYRYPTVTTEEMKALAPDLILLSSEPYPFKQKDIKELQEEVGIKVKLVDGEIFSWYGSRMKFYKNHVKTLFS